MAGRRFAARPRRRRAGRIRRLFGQPAYTMTLAAKLVHQAGNRRGDGVGRASCGCRWPVPALPAMPEPFVWRPADGGEQINRAVEQLIRRRSIYVGLPATGVRVHCPDRCRPACRRAPSGLHGKRTRDDTVCRRKNRRCMKHRRNASCLRPRASRRAVYALLKVLAHLLLGIMARPGVIFRGGWCTCSLDMARNRGALPMNLQLFFPNKMLHTASDDPPALRAIGAVDARPYLAVAW